MKRPAPVIWLLGLSQWESARLRRELRHARLDLNASLIRERDLWADIAAHEAIEASLMEACPSDARSLEPYDQDAGS